MKTSIAVLPLILFACGRGPSPSPSTVTGDSPLAAAFVAAADKYDVPAEILAATAYSETALIDETKHWDEPRVNGMPRAAGVMGLLEVHPTRSIERAAELTGHTQAELVRDLFANVEGGAAILRRLADQRFGKGTLHARGDRERWLVAVADYFDAGPVGQKLALEVRKNVAQGLVAHDALGRTVVIPSFAELSAPEPRIGQLEQAIAGEYPGSSFVAASSSNFTSANRGQGDIDMVVIHTTQGSYAGAISWFANPAAQASAHYVVRASDGDITQTVHHADIAWHAGNWPYNVRSIGIEHEGYITDPNWVTETMYQASANLTRWLCDNYGIPKDRSHIIGHVEVPNQSHTDPGQYWDWNHYMSLVTGGQMMPPPSTGTLKGVVYVGSNTSQRVPGASVTVDPGSHTLSADAMGYFEIGLQPGDYTVSAAAPGYTGMMLTRTITAGMDTWGSVSLTPVMMTTTGLYKGVVYDARHADLSVKLANAKVTLSNGMTAMTGADGGFSFTVAPGSYTATAELSGFETNTSMRTVTAGGTAWGSIGLSPVGTAQPPAIPDPRNPIGGVEVVSARPIFTVVGLSDPQNLALTVEVEIYGDVMLSAKLSEVHVVVPASTAVASWQHPADDLPRASTLYWRARADDGQAASAWSTPQSFVTPDDGKKAVNAMMVLPAEILAGIGPDQPPAGGAILDPKDNTKVASTRPSITAGSATDPEGDPLSYAFEISKNDVFEGVFAKSPLVHSAGSFTSWQPEAPLDRGVRYYVRVRAADPRLYGPWSAVVAFEVDPGATTPPSDAAGGTKVTATIQDKHGCQAVEGPAGWAPFLVLLAAVASLRRRRALTRAR